MNALLVSLFYDDNLNGLPAVKWKVEQLSGRVALGAKLLGSISLAQMDLQSDDGVSVLCSRYGRGEVLRQ